MVRLPMRKVREVLRLKAAGRSHRQIASALCISSGAVSAHAKRAERAGMTWQAASALTDAEVEGALFRDGGRTQPHARHAIDFAHVHHELHRDGVTLQLLWEEYSAASSPLTGGALPYRYSQFCELYAAWRRRLLPTQRQVHRAGEKAFIDYSGRRLCLTDPATGDTRPVELFVMVLGASSYTYAEASRSQQLAEFVASTGRALAFFGGAPQILVPDQLRSAVRRPDRYDPDINETFQDFAQHHSCTVLPARPGRPRDKAKVEGAVLIVQRWIVARLRNRKFFSLADLNVAIMELVDDLNRRPFKKLPGSRTSAFDELDRPALQPLPAAKFLLVERRRATVHIDYHVQFRERLYSVPARLVSEKVEIRSSLNVVEIFHKGERVATHERSFARPGTAVTLEAHRPPQHLQGSWPPERIQSWAKSQGPALATVVERTMKRFRRPEDSYRACLGIIRLANTYGAERADAACRRVLAASPDAAPHRKHIEAILKRGLDKTDTPASTDPAPHFHENIRGGDYYETKETIH